VQANSTTPAELDVLFTPSAVVESPSRGHRGLVVVAGLVLAYGFVFGIVWTALVISPLGNSASAQQWLFPILYPVGDAAAVTATVGGILPGVLLGTPELATLPLLFAYAFPIGVAHATIVSLLAAGVIRVVHLMRERYPK
jgi:hypothetical protein